MAPPRTSRARSRSRHATCRNLSTRVPQPARDVSAPLDADPAAGTRRVGTSRRGPRIRRATCRHLATRIPHPARDVSAPLDADPAAGTNGDEMWFHIAAILHRCCAPRSTTCKCVWDQNLYVRHFFHFVLALPSGSETVPGSQDRGIAGVGGQSADSCRPATAAGFAAAVVHSLTRDVSLRTPRKEP